MRRFFLAVLLGAALTVPAAAENKSVSAPAQDAVGTLARQLLYEDPAVRMAARLKLERRGNPDVAAALIQALRFARGDRAEFGRTLAALTGADHGGNWHDWMLWQEANPQIKPFAGFDAFKADVMALIDENFRLFLRAGIEHEIRLEEITWGGVRKDGIPSLDNPTLLAAGDARYLEDKELVFGVEINGDVRAYPLRILDWHEMFNDVVGGVPVALAYCTLCGSGILYETGVAGRAEPFVFGSSGFLYRSNKLMFDRATHSLWNQFTGRPVVGPLTGSGITLKVRPITITTWKDWHSAHPDTKVLSLETGYARDYRPGKPYSAYFDSPDLMFPALVPGDAFKPKDYVFALRDGSREKAWPLSAFAGGRVVNDRVEDLDVVLVGSVAGRTVRAYARGGRTFEATGSDLRTLVADGQRWRISEEALIGPGGERLRRLPGHIAYWFAWSNFKTDAPVQTN